MGKKKGILIIALFVQVSTPYIGGHDKSKNPQSRWVNKHGISSVNIESLLRGKVKCMSLVILQYIMFSWHWCSIFCSMQVGKEHLGLKAITDVLQDLQYKVIRRAALLETKAKNMTRTLLTKNAFLCVQGKTKIIPCFNPNTLLPGK